MRLNRSTILNSQTVLHMIQSIVTAIKCSDMKTCSLTRKTQVTCSLALPLTTFHKFNRPDIEILTYSYLNLKVRIQRRLSVCLLKKNLRICGPVQFKSVVFKGQLYSLCCTRGDLSIHWLWYPQGSQNPPRILRENFNCITFTYLSNTRITCLSKCGPQANSSITWKCVKNADSEAPLKTGLVTGFGMGTQQVVSLVAQMIKNLPAMQEIPVRSLGWEDPREKGTTHSSILAWRITWTIPWGHKESDTTEWLSLSILWIVTALIDIKCLDHFHHPRKFFWILLFCILCNEGFHIITVKVFKESFFANYIQFQKT